jgi:hypothetical protein
MRILFLLIFPVLSLFVFPASAKEKLTVYTY